MRPPHTDLEAFPTLREKLESYRTVQRMAADTAAGGGKGN